MFFFRNSLSASWPVRELSSPRFDWPRYGLSASCPASPIDGYATKSQSRIIHEAGEAESSGPGPQ